MSSSSISSFSLHKGKEDSTSGEEEKMADMTMNSHVSKEKVKDEEEENQNKDICKRVLPLSLLSLGEDYSLHYSKKNMIYRMVFLRMIGFIYFFAFLSYYIQYPGLNSVSSPGLLPCDLYLKNIKNQLLMKIQNTYPNVSTLQLPGNSFKEAWYFFREVPCLSWFYNPLFGRKDFDFVTPSPAPEFNPINPNLSTMAPTRETKSTIFTLDEFHDFICLLGGLLSFLVGIGISKQRITDNSLSFLLIFLCYSTLVTIGQRFYTFQWDILLLEVGFFCILYARHPYIIDPTFQIQLKSCLSTHTHKKGKETETIKAKMEGEKGEKGEEGEETEKGEKGERKIEVKSIERKKEKKKELENIVLVNRAVNNGRSLPFEWLGQFILFKLMFMSGVVKIQSKCPSWLRMTALEYHFATQPLPSPLAWLLHNLHPAVLRFSTANALIIELVGPFLLLIPAPGIKQVGILAQVFLQVAIIGSGNYTYFNILTMALLLPCAANYYLILNPDHALSSSTNLKINSGNLRLKLLNFLYRNKVSLAFQQLLGWSILIVSGFLLIKMEKIQKDQLYPYHYEFSLTFTPEQLNHYLSLYVPYIIKGCFCVYLLSCLSSLAHLVSHVRYSSIIWKFYKIVSLLFLCLCGGTLFLLTEVPLYNLTNELALRRGHYVDLLPQQVTLYEKIYNYRISSGYGLFRSMTGMKNQKKFSQTNDFPLSFTERPEIVLEYLTDEDLKELERMIQTNPSLLGEDQANSPNLRIDTQTLLPWREVEFTYKPGNLYTLPKFNIPFHPRLDWQMWFAALGHYSQDPWIINLMYQLLHGNKDTLRLLNPNYIFQSASSEEQKQETKKKTDFKVEDSNHSVENFFIEKAQEEDFGHLFLFKQWNNWNGWKLKEKSIEKILFIRSFKYGYDFSRIESFSWNQALANNVHDNSISLVPPPERLTMISSWMANPTFKTLCSFAQKFRSYLSTNTRRRSKQKTENIDDDNNDEDNDADKDREKVQIWSRCCKQEYTPMLYSDVITNIENFLLSHQILHVNQNQNRNENEKQNGEEAVVNVSDDDGDDNGKSCKNKDKGGSTLEEDREKKEDQENKKEKSDNDGRIRDLKEYCWNGWNVFLTEVQKVVQLLRKWEREKVNLVALHYPAIACYLLYLLLLKSFTSILYRGKK